MPGAQQPSPLLPRSLALTILAARCPLHTHLILLLDFWGNPCFMETSNPPRIRPRVLDRIGLWGVWGAMHLEWKPRASLPLPPRHGAPCGEVLCGCKAEEKQQHGLLPAAELGLRWGLSGKAPPSLLTFPEHQDTCLPMSGCVRPWPSACHTGSRGWRGGQAGRVPAAPPPRGSSRWAGRARGAGDTPVMVSRCCWFPTVF